MIISVINHTRNQLSDEEVQHAIRAVNRQIADDFFPYWSLPQKQDPADLRGDAIIYLWDKSDVKNALGYHDTNNRGIPFGFIFLDIVQAVGEDWTVTFSHEALELVADPEVNLLVMGPHPTKPRKTVFHWYEMCDAVQAESYKVDGVAVSNFLLPLYFTSSEEVGGRNDFLGRTHSGRTLQSFGVNPGGYIGFFNPETGDHETFMIKGDAVAAVRLAAKGKAAMARRSIRYQSYAAARKTLARRLGKQRK